MSQSMKRTVETEAARARIAESELVMVKSTNAHYRVLMGKYQRERDLADKRLKVAVAALTEIRDRPRFAIWRTAPFEIAKAALAALEGLKR